MAGGVIPSDVPGSLAMGIRQPAGVVLGIAPVERADHPRRARHLRAAGLRQHGHPQRRNCPRTHQLIVEVVPGRGLSAGVVNYITNARPMPARWWRPWWRTRRCAASIHRQHAVGKLIADDLRQVPQAVVLELGGKAPLVVLDDADVDDAVNGAAFGCFANSGQICMSTERIIVDQKIADGLPIGFADKDPQPAAGRPAQARAGGAGQRDRHEHGGALQCVDGRRAGRAPGCCAAARPTTR